MMAWNCARAAEMNLVDSPLFLGTSIDANVFFMVDDSGSMDWEFMTSEHDSYRNYWEDEDHSKRTNGLFYSRTSNGSGHITFEFIYNNADDAYSTSSSNGSRTNDYSFERDWRGRSSGFNLIYYDPTVTYEPWVGLGLPDASFSAARSNPNPGTDGYTETRDLDGFIYEVAIDDHGYGGSRPDGPTDMTDGANGLVDLWDSRTLYTVNDANMTAITYTVPSATVAVGLNTDCNHNDATDTTPYEDCFGTTASATTTYNSSDVNPFGRTLAQEQTNIANWYSYYRKRQLLTKASIAAVINAANDFRYGLSMINDDDLVFEEVPAAAVSDYTTHNADMLDAFFDYEWQGQGTPLRGGLKNVGEYYDGDRSGVTDPIISQCQQNFSILMTDGYWNGSSPSGIGDADSDGRSVTVADVAKFYYDKDLSPLANNVPTSVVDGNNDQHMVTFTVAYGVTGDLVDTDSDKWPNPVLAEDDTWGANPSSNNQGKIDDMWHAAFNSKGEFVAAQTPQQLVNSLTSALSEISDRVGSSASVATNSGSLNAGSHLFQARFDSGGWSGQLIAFPLQADGTLNPNESWEASEVLDTQNPNIGREILTWNPLADVIPGGAPEGQGVPFRFPSNHVVPNPLTEMTDEQIEYLLTYGPYDPNTVNVVEQGQNQTYGEAYVNYLRGDRTNEGTGFNFRLRNSALGDIVDSDPQFVGQPRGRYPDNIESGSYSAFKTTHAARASMVYVGANDGMLHGFAEADGVEKIAYIPNKVYEKLPELGEAGYIHEYFVNEPPTIVDAWHANYGGTGAWRTTLVGPLGHGGQGLFALDVTDPTNFDESNAADIVLWEFTDEQDADLGYTFGSVSIAKMHDGSWAAVFSNGYNNTEADGAASTTGHAYLYIVDIETGALIKKIDTGVGSAGTPNGLSSPALIDIDRDFVVDYIYAGDLEGNLWKFDVTSASTSNWDVAWKDGSTPKPLFTAPAGQPITTRPQVAAHPDDLVGYMVYFGTGQYLETGDNDPTGATTQAFYGVWDKDDANVPNFTTANLLQQFITNQRAAGFDTDDDMIDDRFFTLRDVSDNTINFNSHRGWYINLLPLKVEGVDNTSNFGEKQVSNALVRDGRVIFTTLIPSQNQCDFGGSSFIMELDFRDGGLLEFPPFDLNGDGEFDSDDQYVGGSQTDVGIVPTLSIITDGDSETAFGSGSSGDVESFNLNVGDNALGRQSWRQLQ